MDGNNFVLYPNVEREMNGQTICACYKHELVFASLRNQTLNLAPLTKLDYPCSTDWDCEIDNNFCSVFAFFQDPRHVSNFGVQYKLGID